MAARRLLVPLLVAYARRKGRNAGDDRIVELVQENPDATVVNVVTSDRDLSELWHHWFEAAEGEQDFDPTDLIEIT